jgi:type II secretory pathway component GspD/PulD (secretin)
MPLQKVKIKKDKEFEMKRIFLILIMLWMNLAFLMSIHHPNYVFAQTQTPTSTQSPTPTQSQSEYAIEDDKAPADNKDEGLVSLDFKDADLKDVLKVFSQQSGLNFVAAKDIENRAITLYMNDVLVEDALKTLLDANNLGLEQNPGSNILIVKAKPTVPIQTITRVYKIRYYHGNVSPGSYLLSEGKGKESDGKGTGDWSNIIKPLLSQFGVVIDYTNILIVTDVPDRFKLIDQVISEIDRPIPEVMLEVELIETTSKYLKELGMKWDKSMMSMIGASASTTFPFSSERAVGRDAPPSFNYGLLSSSAMKWTLEMLQTDNDTKFLSKPRILVQDREWAEIKVTADQIVSIETTKDKDTGDVTTKVQRMEIGTILRLVPIINAEEGYVSILLEPSISRPVDSIFKNADGNFVDPHSRSMRTVVMSRDGETIAIGGFITTEDQNIKTKVPWLGDLPFFGAFFRHNGTNREDKELLIFVTPRIVKPTEKVEAWMNDSAAKTAETELASTAPHAVTKTVNKSQQSSSETSVATKDNQVAKQSDANSTDFREQEDTSEKSLDLTVQSSSLSSVDLVK